MNVNETPNVLQVRNVKTSDVWLSAIRMLVVIMPTVLPETIVLFVLAPKISSAMLIPDEDVTPNVFTMPIVDVIKLVTSLSVLIPATLLSRFADRVLIVM